MAKVIYKKECGEGTYSEDTCPFCRMNGVLTELEYDGSRTPSFFDEKGNKEKCYCGTCGGNR